MTGLREKIVLCVGIAFAVSGCHQKAHAAAPHHQTACDPDGFIRGDLDTWHVDTTPRNRDLEINSRDYDILADDARCLPELRPMIRKAMERGKITFAERDAIEVQAYKFRWARMERVINADTAAARNRLRIASGIAAGTDTTPKGGVAEGKSPVPKGDAQH